MKKVLLRIWYFFPFWLQHLAAGIIRTHYQVAVAGLIFNSQGQLMLCEHSYRRLYPWGLPGGDLKPGEDPMDGIKREIFEETSLLVHDVRLLLIENSTRYHHIVIIYNCSGVSGSFQSSDDVLRVSYFDPDKFPPLLESQKLTIDRALGLLREEKG